MISVIIPSYNRADTLARAIQSVLNQSYSDFELIIVDDASTDKTAEIIQKFSDPRIAYLKHEKNQGAAAARNTGIKQSKGEWLAFLDSDDEWSSTKLERQLEFIKQQHSDVLVTCTGYTLNLLDDDKQIIRTLEHHQDINVSIFDGCDISPGSTMLAKKSAFEQVGNFDTYLQRLEDWDWLIRYRKMGKIALLQEPLATVHNRRGREGKALENSIPHFLSKLNLKNKKTIAAQVWLQAVGTYRREGNYLKTIQALLKAHYWDPLILLKI